MGTFHQGKSELHGITVVVDTDGPEVWVGRCDDEDGQAVVLLDADVHRASPERADEELEASKDAWVRRAARFGVWGRHARVVLPRRRVTSIRRLGEVAGDAG